MDETSQTTETVVISSEELRMLIEDAVATGSASSVDSFSDRLDDAVSSLSSSLSSAGGTAGVVTLDSSQYRQLRSDFAASLYSFVVCVGVLSLILGAVVALSFTSHWKSRG